MVYTPEWLAAFVVDRTLDGLSPTAGTRWLDPACGDGVFLVELVRRLAASEDPESLPHVVATRLFGVDIDPLACARARAAVVATVAELAGPQHPEFFAENVRVADFLELEPDTIGRFDIVVGNPPYVGATGLTAAQKARFLERFATAWGRLDLYTLFTEQGLRLLTPGGRLGFITPDKWLTAASSRRLRAFAAQEFVVRSIDRFHRHDLFPGVATVPCVAVLHTRRSPAEEADSAPCRWWDVGTSDQPAVESASVLEIHPDGRPWARAYQRREAGTVPLGELVERISAGIATGLNRCFVLKDPGAIEPELLRPVIRGRDVNAGGGLNDPGLWVLVPYRFGAGAELIDLDEFPGAAAHLAPYREALEARHCVRVWHKAWHDLHDPVLNDLAPKPKILVPDIGYEPRFGFDTGRFTPMHSAYYMLPRVDAPVDAESLTAILNSAPIAAELRRRAPTAKSGYRRFRAQYLRELPIPVAGRADDEELEARVAHALKRDAA